ncbi:hypothetical protein [Arthrobacter sp.]|uniref:hypothetical protein n=1 Tax=Arthrobacter sp. TaxID=1667 RepID=UPI0025842BBB|nr:hypothetical protein [Arthrobacter sp.]
MARCGPSPQYRYERYDPRSMALFQMACNRTEQACGCVTWYQLESGAWVPRRWPCNRHDVQEAP